MILKSLPCLAGDITRADISVQIKLRYSKTCLKWPLKIDKTKTLMTNGSLMKIKSIAECSPEKVYKKDRSGLSSLSKYHFKKLTMF